MTTSTMIAGYLALFVAFGFAFLFVNLVVGKFLRPKAPNPEKLEIYECGEPTIGSSFVQFDIRFYVVALLFIIFDVEVAFFFPWANVFGKSTHLMDPNLPVVQSAASSTDSKPALTPAAAGIYRELSVPEAAAPHATEEIRSSANQLAWLALVDILAFFAILMVGFAYVWRRGDLDWVRATAQEPISQPQRIPSSGTVELEPVMMA
ncbi:MAG TPA: NADH-quinone oxidoreductase subunit A [Pirellulales bacterium]|nr:NADH-quinone oxidoreductase subunit A [Pirellulales bacterium]